MLAALCVVLFLTAARPAQEREMKQEQDQKAIRLIPSLEGSDLFHSYCAPCHGINGKGAGPVAPALKPRVPDLTSIAKRNGGLFPMNRVERTIAGDDFVMAHGTREMPIWGPVFHQIEEDRDYGNIRLRNLAKYIETMQEK